MLVVLLLVVVVVGVVVGGGDGGFGGFGEAKNLVKVEGLGPIPFHLLVLVTHWWHCHLRLCNLLNIREIIWWQAILGNI